MDCQYCKRSFSNKSSLTNHQKTAKYCLNTMNLLWSLRSFIGEEAKGIETESIDYVVKNIISKSVLWINKT